MKKLPAPDTDDREDSDADRILPALADEITYNLKEFIPINEEDSDKDTTESDLNFLNNHLAICDGLLPHIKTLDGLCSLSNTVCKLIEVRRKVKKLEFGSMKISGGKGLVILD